MTTWTTDELGAIETADELEVAPVRRDGTLHGPVPIWVVRDGDDLYVRSYRGTEGAWYRTARTNGAGHIRAGGIDKDVTFVAETDSDVNDRVDAAYRTKYSRYGGSYVKTMVAPGTRATTLKLLPR
ncbi:DUF2255 family protein [Streptomyces sp. NPDC051105]|uniref:DUF2255 family protein n=1 Tax=Streptomyces sp. NPDC051105 TaxID=3154843 RepID=UPI003432D69F